MLTNHSHIAIDYLLPFIKKINSKPLQTFWSLLESIDVDYDIISTKDVEKYASYESLIKYSFIDEPLKQQIVLLSNYKEVTIKSGNHTFHLSFYYDKQDNIELLIDTLAFCLTFVAKIANHNVKDIHICYYLLNSKRILNDDTYLDKTEVNGGLCESSQSNCDIVVWRKEEIIKVSIHELIHGLSYDYKQDTPDITNHYKQKYGITSPVMNTFEAYTEIFAELIHSYLLSRIIHGVKKHIDPFMLFTSFVSIEHEFSLLQCSKVLRLLDLNKDVNKETNVAAYYIITTELYNDLHNFLKFCIATNDNIVNMLDVSNYFNYLKKLKSPVNPKKYNLKDRYLQTTTRMTCLELDLL
jgi:hypothetical protein